MTLHELLLLFLANSLFIFGLYKAFDVDFLDDDNPQQGVDNNSKEIFWFVKYYSVKKLGWYWSKPICVCPPCMGFLHSTYVYWTAVHFYPIQHPLPTYILYFFSLIGFNYFVTIIKTKLSK